MADGTGTAVVACCKPLPQPFRNGEGRRRAVRQNLSGSHIKLNQTFVEDVLIYLDALSDQPLPASFSSTTIRQWEMTGATPSFSSQPATTVRACSK